MTPEQNAYLAQLGMTPPDIAAHVAQGWTFEQLVAARAPAPVAAPPVAAPPVAAPPVAPYMAGIPPAAAYVPPVAAGGAALASIRAAVAPNSYADDLRGTKENPRGKDGTYLVRVKELIMKPLEGGLTVMKIPLDVLESSNPAIPVGAPREHALHLQHKPASSEAQGIMQIMYCANGGTGQFTDAWYAAATGEGSIGAAGQVYRLTCQTKPQKNDASKFFTHVTWTHAPGGVAAAAPAAPPAATAPPVAAVAPPTVVAPPGAVVAPPGAVVVGPPPGAVAPPPGLVAQPPAVAALLAAQAAGHAATLPADLNSDIPF